MTIKQKTEIIDAIKSQKFFDYIWEHFHEWSRYEMRTILLEYVYQIESSNNLVAIDGIVEELIERLDAE